MFGNISYECHSCIMKILIPTEDSLRFGDAQKIFFRIWIIKAGDIGNIRGRVEVS